MVYRVFTRSREHWLTGTPGLDLEAACRAFYKLIDKETRFVEIIQHYSPGEPLSDDLEDQALIACLCAELGLQERGMTEVCVANCNKEAD